MYSLFFKKAIASLLVPSFLAFVLAGIGTPETHAAMINVPCDVSALIDAMDTANADDAADTLELASDCVYVLTAVNNSTPHPNGLPIITTDITFNGNNLIARAHAIESLVGCP